jgi:hypothetical protein
MKCGFSKHISRAILSLPNEDFGRMNKRWNPDGSTFQGREYSFWATKYLKVSRKAVFHHLFLLPKSSFGEHKFGPWTIEKCLENPHFIFCSSFQNLRLGAIKSFWCLLESILIVEYSRMHVPSLSSGCEIAPFLVRHAGHIILSSSWLVQTNLVLDEHEMTCRFSAFCHTVPFLFILPQSSFERSKERYGEPKMARFRTHYLTKEVAYVSTQSSGYFPIDTEMI